MAAITSNGTGGGVWSAGATWTGAAVPAEGDTVIIQNGDTITIDQNITVGADTTTAAIEIASGGKLEVLHTVAADYILTLKGDLKISSGGTLEIGTVANPIPTARKFTIKLNYSGTLAEGKYGLLNYGSMIIQGASKTVKTLLTGDLAATGAVWTVGDTTDWEVSDRLAIASTTRTWSEAEDKVIQTVDSGTQVTMTAGATNAHSGTSPTQAEVINLTRNVMVTSHTPASYRGYVCCYSGSTSNVDYVEFYMIGYTATYKRGIEIRTTAVGTNFAYCSVWGNAASNYPFYLYQVENVLIDNCVIYDVDEEFYVYMGSDNTITNCVVMKMTDYGLYSYNSSNFTFEYNVFTSCSSHGLWINNGSFSSFTNITAHSNYYDGMKIYAPTLTASSLTAWRNHGTTPAGIYLIYPDNSNIDGITCFGNRDKNLYIYNPLGISHLSNVVLDGEPSYPTAYGLYLKFCQGKLYIEDSDFGSTSVHASADIYVSDFVQLIIKNTKLSSTTKVSNINNTILSSYVQCEDLGQVQYADKAWYKYGIVVRDSTTKKTNTYSTRFDYLWAADDWLEYELEIPVKSGKSIVVSAWLRKNSSYTSANRPKIKLSGMGITETEDQMSDVTDTWETVTVSGAPTRTGLAKLTIMTYLTNSGASAWVDFDNTGVTQPVLNTLTGDFWADGHFSTILFDTGTITPAEFWKTLTATIDETGSFGDLFKDYIDAAISGRAPANEYDAELTAIQADLDSPDQYKADISALATSTEVAKIGKKVDRNYVWLLP